MIHLPFINKFPYTSMEAVNIDWLLNEVSKIPVLEEKVNQHETRITDLETTISDHEQRLQAAEGDIDALEGRMDTAEGDIDQIQDDMSSVKDRMTAAEGDIDTLENVVGDSTSGLVKDVSDLQQDVSDIKQDVIDIKTKDQAQDNDITALDLRVTTLENEDSVIANPGGTGPLLNTVRISGTTYSIDNSGGGGGGGSSVTPNPAGTPTAVLDSVDIDGTIYDMPVHASDINSINLDIAGLDTRLDTLEDTIEDTGTVISVSASNVTAAANNVFEIPDTEFVVPEGRTVLCCASCSFNSNGYGSTPRYLGFYIRKTNDGEPVSYTNVGLAKFSVIGNEPAMITEAANMNIAKILTAGTYHLALRCNTNDSTTRIISYSVSADVVTLREDPNA